MSSKKRGWKRVSRKKDGPMPRELARKAIEHSWAVQDLANELGQIAKTSEVRRIAIKMQRINRRVQTLLIPYGLAP